MINYKELLKGDYILVNGKLAKVESIIDNAQQPIRVNVMFLDEACYISDVFLSDCEPIPLNEKMVKRIGFSIVASQFPPTKEEVELDPLAVYRLKTIYPINVANKEIVYWHPLSKEKFKLVKNDKGFYFACPNPEAKDGESFKAITYLHTLQNAFNGIVEKELPVDDVY